MLAKRTPRPLINDLGSSGQHLWVFWGRCLRGRDDEWLYDVERGPYRHVYRAQSPYSGSRVG